MIVWPRVVAQILAVAPTLPGWSTVPVIDTDPLTGEDPPVYVVVARTSDVDTSGNFVRQGGAGDLTLESGTVRLHIVTRTGSADPATPGDMRSQGFALLAPLEAYVAGDQTLGGVLGPLGTATLTVDVQSVAGPQGVGQSLVVSVNYTSQTP